MTALPDFGRDVTVKTPFLGDEKELGLPRRYLVAVDDDAEAKALVAKHEDFAPNDDQELSINPNPVPKKILSDYGMVPGEVRKIETDQEGA